MHYSVENCLSKKILIALCVLIGYNFFGATQHTIVAENSIEMSSISKDRTPHQEFMALASEHMENLPVVEEIIPEIVKKERDMYIVNYYPDDSTGSGNTTASGLGVSDFTLSTEGFYRYNGMLVGAMPVGTELHLGNGETYYLYENYKYYSLGDTMEVEFEYNNTIYNEKIIILDVCGACYGMPHESKQRVDIFTSHSVIGKRDAREVSYE